MKIYLYKQKWQFCQGDIIIITIIIIIIILIIIIISIFKEDNVFSIIANLPYGPPVNTDIDYYQTFFRTFI